MRTELLKSQLERLVLGVPSQANINHLGRKRRNRIHRLRGTEYVGRTRWQTCTRSEPEDRKVESGGRGGVVGEEGGIPGTCSNTASPS